MRYNRLVRISRILAVVSALALIVSSVGLGVGTASAVAAGPARWVSAVPAPGAVTVSWLPPATGGPVTGYQVSLAPGGQTTNLPATGRVHTFTGLTNGTTYTATVTAKSADGDNAVQSNPVTPMAATGFTCHRWASATGDDAAAGTPAAPAATLRGLVSKLSPGQTGCVKSGETLDDSGGWGILQNGGTPGAPITVRTEPGGARATLSGQIHVPGGINDVILTGLNLVGPTTGVGKNSLLLLEGERISVTDNVITYPLGICFNVGTPALNYLANDLVVARNRIHHCGTSPDLVWTTADSGAHGLYIKATNRAVVADNVIYGNKFRGLQTYPNPKNVAVINNVLDGNASNINLGHQLDQGYVSESVLVSRNVITNATLFEPDGGVGKNPAQIHSTIPTNTHDNLVERNCMYQPDATKNFDGTAGYTQDANTIVPDGSALYVDRAAANYAIDPTSPCAGFGPRTTTTSGAEVTTTLVRNTTPAVIGSPVTFTATVTNAGGATATAVDAVFTVDDQYTSVSAVPSRGTCGSVVSGDLDCPLGDLAAGQSASITLTATPTAPIYAYLSLIAYPGNASPSPLVNVDTLPVAAPAGVPGLPASVTVTGGIGAATVTWTPPTDPGSSPLTGYTITTTPGGTVTNTGPAATSAAVTGLSSGTSYTFAVRAVNAAGPSLARQASAKGSVLSLSAAPSAVTYGSTARVSGTLTSLAGLPQTGRAVRVLARPSGAASFTALTTATTDDTGRFVATIKPVKGTTYQASFAGAPSLMGRTSATLTVAVRAKVALTASAAKVKRGKKVTFTTAVTPHPSGLRVTLQRATPSGWTTVTTKTVGPSGSARFTWRSSKKRTVKFRVVTSTLAGIASGTSPTRTVKVR